jgi:hypothetical protein
VRGSKLDYHKGCTAEGGQAPPPTAYAAHTVVRPLASRAEATMEHGWSSAAIAQGLTERDRHVGHHSPQSGSRAGPFVGAHRLSARDAAQHRNAGVGWAKSPRRGDALLVQQQIGDSRFVAKLSSKILPKSE